MVEKLYEGIYRIGVELRGNPLKELNSYFIRGTDSDLLIDTGFRRPACREALQAGLEELQYDPSRLDVLATHLHSDHCGMADLFVGPERHIFISETDAWVFKKHRGRDLPEIRENRFLKEGFPEDMLNIVMTTNPAFTERCPGFGDHLVTLCDGDILQVGEYRLKTLLVPGHTPGNCMFYLQDEEIMFTGDHILFDITPNITYWPCFEDSLGNYLASLKKVRDLPVKMALPGHRQTGNYRERIDALLEHHERRLAEAYSVIKENPGLNAYEIAGQMRWRIRASSWDDFPVIQKWFAVGECLSHLDYHLIRGHIRCEEDGDGNRRYYESIQH